MLNVLRIVALILVALSVLMLTVWGTLALWIRLPVAETGRLVIAGSFALIGTGVSLAQMTRARLKALGVFTLALLCVAFWWRGIEPPQNGNWSPDVAHQVTGVIQGDQLTLTNVRNFEWRAPGDFTPHWETRSYDLNSLNSVDLFMSYWDESGIAHMVVSFGFENDDHIAWSVEVRREIDSTYSPVADMFKTHTLVLIAADERDVIGTRTNTRDPIEDVRLYRLNTDPETGRAILRSYVDRANQLAAQPEWYNSIITNCTTVVFSMVRELISTVPLDWRVFLNGHLPEYAYEQGTMTSDISFEELEAAADINPAAQAFGLKPGFSRAIRENVPDPNH
ncbi:MAG: Lnb N-terminal periplasmic domain-containing protein [Paracoccaceae bacterium]